MGAFRTALSLLAGFVLLATASGASASPPIWRIRQGGADITLFGSVHLLPDKLDWRTPELDAAIAHADQVWFEVPLDPASQAEAARLALAKSRLPEGQTLSALLAAPDRERLIRVATALGVWPSLDRLQPWIADTTLSTLYAQRHAARRDRGVEGEVERALSPTVERRFFETTADQIGLLADAAAGDQVASLRTTLQEIETDPDAYDRVVAAWASGDVDRLQAETIRLLRRDDPALYERLVVARNRRWVATLSTLLKSPRRVVIVVGVGHLVGPDGVPARLRRLGVKVRGP